MFPPAASTNATASALNSGVNLRRFLLVTTNSFRISTTHDQVSVKPGQPQPPPNPASTSPPPTRNSTRHHTPARTTPHAPRCGHARTPPPAPAPPDQEDPPYRSPP